MAHFAEIGLNNIVLRVIVVSDNDCKNEAGYESEAVGAEFCRTLFGGTWIQTSYHGNIRKNYAGVGDVYDAQRDAFIAPKTFPSWVLDEIICRWVPPVEKPSDGKKYKWNEEQLEWIEIV